MKIIERTERFDVPASPDRVFPLLCPVREYDWIPGWECEVLHTVSGVAEEDCVFRTRFPRDGNPMTWVVSRYEPPARIEFTCFVPESHVMRLRISLEAESNGTRLHWTRRWYSVGPTGDAWIAAWSEAAYRQNMTDLERRLAHYLAAGERLAP